MNDVAWLHEPSVRRPILLTAFEGWFDAGEAATTAVDWLAEAHTAGEFARIDAEPFFDFQQERPRVYVTDAGTRAIEWPDTTCRSARVGAGDHDLVLLSGTEPHLRWRSFTDAVIDVARATGTELIVTLGANFGTVPHTRPFEVVGSSTNPELATRLGLGEPSYEGPTGVVGALHSGFDDAEIPVISLRVTTPHYVQGGPNPKAARSLLERLQLVTGVRTRPEHFDAEAAAWEDRVNEAVAEDHEVQQYVEMLEQQVDETIDLSGSPEDLAAEVEAFLREQSDE